MTKDTDANSSPEFLTVEQLALLLQLPETTVYQLVRRRVLPGTKYGKQWRFYRPDIIQWHRENATVSPTRQDSIGESRFVLESRGDIRPITTDRQKQSLPSIAPYNWGQETSR
ncbi:MAG: helix-turn-helix domain-containing protein [Deltaproteobacteria bacterium]|nr:helix-turn-helix domain-containing protein [Deltaproteobacteria bacterium]MCB9488925.1 helix-turn-helix domain-containing protein [Deltaproteobacteria bacterium]